MDIHGVKTRSYNMSSIKAKDTKPEIIVRKFLFANGLRYRKNVQNLPGKPDIVLPKYKIVVLVHGCFWHGHDCRAARLPETNHHFWQDKIDANKCRDTRNIEDLKKVGWKVIVIWQCEIKNKQLREERFVRLIDELKENGF